MEEKDLSLIYPQSGKRKKRRKTHNLLRKGKREKR